MKRRRERLSGIYGAFVAGRVYVGASHDVLGRIAQHRRELRRGSHPRAALQQAYNDDGRLVFLVLELVENPARLRRCETRWIKRLKAIAQGFNTNLSLGHRAWRQEGRQGVHS